MPKRACKAKKADGSPCRAAPLKEGDFCLAHADPETRESTGFVADNGKGGRKPNPKVTDVLRERVEQLAEEIIRVYVEALEAQRPVVVGNGPSATLEMAPDEPTRLKAADALLDRVYGRPKQSTEVSGPDKGPLPVEHLVPADMAFQAEVAKVAIEAGLVELPEPHSNGNGNGHR